MISNIKRIIRNNQISNRRYLSLYTHYFDSELGIPVLSINNSQRVYLVGTAHVSKKSGEKVREVINNIKPQSVFMELCSQRESILFADESDFKKEIGVKEIYEDLKRGKNAFLTLYGYFISSVATNLETIPGYEFREAYQSAMDQGSQIILGDRPLNITVDRLSKGLTIRNKLSIFFELISSLFHFNTPDTKESVEMFLDDTDFLTTAILEFKDKYPWLAECLIFERDKYMAIGLKSVSFKLKFSIMTEF